MSHHWKLTSASLGLMLMLLLGMSAGCKTAAPTDSQPNETAFVTTTINGMLSDAQGSPIAGAIITAYGRASTTDETGSFLFRDISVPGDRCVVTAQAALHFPAARAEVPQANDATEMRLFAMPTPARQGLPVSGGVITLQSQSGNAIISVPPNAFTDNGIAFTGDAQCAAAHLDPVTPEMALYQSADTRAMLKDGTRAELVSYGIIRADVRTANGALLQVASGEHLTLTFPIPASQQAEAPVKVPLFYFNATLGVWVEDGEAVRQANMYVGTVSHLSDWNAAKPLMEWGTVEGSVTCSGKPVSYVIVTMGERYAITNSVGRFDQPVPAHVPIRVEVDAKTNLGRYASDPVFIPALARKEVADVDLKLTTGCPCIITGRVTDADGLRIPFKLFWKVKDGELASNIFLHDSSFRINIIAHREVEFVASTWLCSALATLKMTTSDPGDSIDIGTLKIICDPPMQSDEFQLSGMDTTKIRIKLSPDGTRFVSADAKGPMIIVRNTSDGSIVSTTTLDEPSYVYDDMFFSSDGSRYLVNGGAKSDWASWVIETETGNILRTVTKHSDCALTTDGKEIVYAVSGSPSHSLEFVSVASGQVTHSYPFDGKGVSYIYDLSNDGRYAIVWSNLLPLSLAWIDLQNAGAVTRSIPSDAASLTGIHVSGDGRRFGFSYFNDATTPTKEFIEIFDQSGTKVLDKDFEISLSDAVDFELDRDGSFVAFQPPSVGGIWPPPVLGMCPTGDLRALSVSGNNQQFRSFSFAETVRKVAGYYVDDQGKPWVRIWDY